MNNSPIESSWLNLRRWRGWRALLGGIAATWIGALSCAAMAVGTPDLSSKLDPALVSALAQKSVDTRVQVLIEPQRATADDFVDGGGRAASGTAAGSRRSAQAAQRRSRQSQHRSNLSPFVGSAPAALDPTYGIRQSAVKATPTGPWASREQRLQAVYAALADTARRSQQGIRQWLDQAKLPYRAFSVVNAIAAELTLAQLAEVAGREDVAYVAVDPVVHNSLPEIAAAKDACGGAGAIPWGVSRVHADALWAMGFRGQGVIVAGQDTGYHWTHPALIGQYLGNGTPADHNYHWHDAIHALINGGSNSCGLNLLAPCDDDPLNPGHGTHTMGTMAGEDDVAGVTVGVAPGAKWIGCRNMEAGDGKPSTYLECFDWFLAPTDLAGNHPDPTRAPHVINNSWGCPISEGCTSANWDLLDTAMSNLTAAGLLVVASAGNSGLGCGTVQDPPAMFASAFSVGASGSSVNNAMAGFSSRGPVTVDGSHRLKPDITAPGVSVCSSIRGTGYSNAFSGTSMAGPHVAGVAALLMSAFPTLKNDPPALRALLTQTALPLPQTQTCGGIPGSAQPNPVSGWGLIDALAAFLQFDPLFVTSFE